MRNVYHITLDQFYTVTWMDITEYFDADMAIKIQYVDLVNTTIREADLKEFELMYKEARGRDNRLNWWNELKAIKSYKHGQYSFKKEGKQ